MSTPTEKPSEHIEIKVYTLLPFKSTTPPATLAELSRLESKPFLFATRRKDDAEDYRFVLGARQGKPIFFVLKYERGTLRIIKTLAEWDPGAPDPIQKSG